MRGSSWNVDPVRILTRREFAAVLGDLTRRGATSCSARLNLTILRLACCCGLRVSEIAGHRVDIWRDHGARECRALYLLTYTARGRDDGRRSRKAVAGCQSDSVILVKRTSISLASDPVSNHLTSGPSRGCQILSAGTTVYLRHPNRYADFRDGIAMRR